MGKSVIDPYENMDGWRKLNKPSLQEKEDFNSYLNTEDITDSDYMYAKTVCKDSQEKSDLYI